MSVKTAVRATEHHPRKNPSVHCTIKQVFLHEDGTHRYKCGRVADDIDMERGTFLPFGPHPMKPTRGFLKLVRAKRIERHGIRFFPSRSDKD